MAKAKNHYDCFQRFFNDTSIDDLMATTEGFQQSEDYIEEVNEWVLENIKPDTEFDDFEEIFYQCLLAERTLWFNLSWRIGWAVGALHGLKKNLEPDIESSTNSLMSSIYSAFDEA